jgi:hypothetical protein
LTPQLLSRFAKFYEPTRSPKNSRAQKIQSQAVIALAAGLGDAAECLVVHSQSAIPFQLFLKFGGVVHL